MTALAAGSSASVTLGDGGTIAIASNFGFWSVTGTQTAGAAISQSYGPRPVRTVLGPFAEGASITITSVNTDLTYDATNPGNGSSDIGVGSSASISIAAGGRLSVASNFGFGSVVGTILPNTQINDQFGPTPFRKVYQGGSLANSLTITSLTAAINCDNFPAASGVIPNQTSIVGIGDSITFGANASTQANRWLERVGVSLGGATVLNQGISGTVLQNSNDSGGSPMANNGRDRFFAALGGINKRNFLFHAYGYNDARYTGAPATFNVTQYAVDYREVMNGLMELGYGPDTMCIVAPYYITDTGLNTGSAGFSGQTRPGFLAFVDAAKAVALEYNTWLADPYTAMLNNGAGALIDTDNIHPTDAGHAVIATAVLASAKANTNIAPVLTVSSPSAGNINWSLSAVAGATSYTVEYMAHNGTTYAFTGTVTGASLSGSFTSLTPNYYTIRARANFASGSSGWVFKRVLASLPTLVSADFAGTAGTLLSAYVPEIGSGFAVQSGYAPASENVLDGVGGVYSQTNAGVYRNATAPLGPNYYVEATLQFYSTLAGDNIGITAYAAAAANTFYFMQWNQGTNQWRLFRNSLGSNTSVATFNDTFTSGTRVIRLTIQDMPGYKQITGSVNGVDRLSYQDPAPLALGPAGIRDAFAKAVGTGIHMIDFKVVQQ